MKVEVDDARVAVQGVTKQFRTNGKTVTALSAVDLTVGEGEFVVLLGPSGCGKTTLLRAIAGLQPPTDGVIRLSGVDLYGTDKASRSAVMARNGFVFQEANLMPWRTNLRNVELPLEVKGAPRAERRKVAAELLELVGLHGFEGSYPRELSGGMRQRVSLARALSHDPDVLLMDEPFGAVDAQLRDVLNLELQRIWLERRKTVIFVTHSIPEAVFLADRVVLLRPRPGRIQTILDVPFARPRPISLLSEPTFSSMVVQLRSQMGDAISEDAD